MSDSSHIDSFEAILDSLTSKLEDAILCTTWLAKARRESAPNVSHPTVTCLSDTCLVADSSPVANARSTSSQSDPTDESEQIELRQIWENGVPHVSNRLQSTNTTKSLFGQDSEVSLSYRCQELDIAVSPNSRGVFHPMSPLRFLWDMVSIVFITFDLLMLPLLAFKIEAGEAVQWVITVFWTLDIVVQARTGFYRGPALIMNRKEVFLHYIKSWAIVDVLIVISEWTARVVKSIDGLNAARLYRLRTVGKLPRMVKTLKLAPCVNRLEILFDTPLTFLLWSLLKMTLVLGILVHILACGWYLVGRSSSDGWVYRDENQALAEEPRSAWITATVWVLAQVNGRTDTDKELTVAERGYTSMCAVFSLAFTSFFVSRLTARMLELQKEFYALRKYSIVFDRFRLRHKLSWRAVFFAKEYIKHRQLIVIDKDEEEQVLDLLPPQMKTDLVYEIRGPLLMRHPLFARFQCVSRSGFRSMCFQATEVLRCLAKEIVFEKGENCEQMLFVDQGTLCYCTHRTIKHMMNQFLEHAHTTESPMLRFLLNSNHDAFFEQDSSSMGVEVGSGTWVSELALWVHWKTCGELFCDTKAKLIAVDVGQFLCVVQQYQEIFAEAAYHARDVVRMINANPRKSLSDVMAFEDLFDSIDEDETKTPTTVQTQTVCHSAEAQQRSCAPALLGL